MYFQSEIDFGMMVLIWIVQLIIYPGFLHYRVAALRKWHSSYTRLITWIVLPLMLGQVVVHGLGLWYDAHAVRWFQLIFIVMSWALTFFRAVPLHNKIQEGVWTAGQHRVADSLELAAYDFVDGHLFIGYRSYVLPESGVSKFQYE